MQKNDQFEVKQDAELINESDEMTMGRLMDDLYYGQGIVSANDVSVHSAFICILHLANEKRLVFARDSECDEEVNGLPSNEADFKIAHAIEYEIS